MGKKSNGPTGNRLLNFLPANELQALQPHFRKIELARDHAIYEARGQIEQIYFPVTSVVSAVTVMRDGDAIEVATIGNEGVVGFPAFAMSAASSPHRVFVQVAGSVLQADAMVFGREIAKLPKLREILTKYQSVFVFQISQCVACNGLHVIIERCCRWLLITHDRVSGDELPLTHEFLSYMLGVRRSSVTEVLQSLQQQGLISYVQGKMTVVNRKGLEDLSCECYQNVRDEYERLLG